MQEKKKKLQLPEWATYALIALEVVVMIGLVTLAFLINGAAAKEDSEIKSKLILFFVQPENKVWFFIAVVFPLIVLFLLNIYILIRVMNQKTNEEFLSMSKEELMEEARRQAREEVLREMEAQKEKEVKVDE